MDLYFKKDCGYYRSAPQLICSYYSLSRPKLAHFLLTHGGLSPPRVVKFYCRQQRRSFKLAERFFDLWLRGGSVPKHVSLISLLVVCSLWSMPKICSRTGTHPSYTATRCSEVGEARIESGSGSGSTSSISTG